MLLGLATIAPPEDEEDVDVDDMTTAVVRKRAQQEEGEGEEMSSMYLLVSDHL